MARDASLLVPPEKPALLQFEGEHVFQFPSPVTSAASENNTVRGRLFPCGADWRNRPLVVIVHGWNAELHYRKVCPLLARGLNKRGMNAALIELPYHLQRRPTNGDASPDFICDNIPGMLNATRQAVADLNALLLWGKVQGCPQTALWGFSLGGWLSGLHVCVSKAQDAAVLAIPVSNLERAISELAFCHPIRAALKVAPIPTSGLNLASHTPRISPEKILLVEGLYDLFVPADTFKKLAEAWHLRGWMQVPQSHISTLFSPSAMRGTMDWLAAIIC
jgi:dienelactone hydrolase